MMKARVHRSHLDKDEDDLVFDVIEELVSDFASDPRAAEDADLGVVVCFLERARDIGVADFESMTNDDVARVTLELLYEHDDEGNVVDSIASFAEWLAASADRQDADSIIDAMFDIDRCELATVHELGR
jgi:hypothetical protein